MKRRVSVFAAFALVLSLAAVAAAEVKKAEPMKAPEAAAPAKAAEPAQATPATKAPAKKMAAKKPPKSHRLTGTVEAVDSAAGTLSVKGKKGSVALKAGEKVNLDRIAVGDKVLVLYSGDTTASVKMVPAKKAARKVAGKAAAAPAASAAQATPAAPATPAERK